VVEGPSLAADYEETQEQGLCLCKPDQTKGLFRRISDRVFPDRASRFRHTYLLTRSMAVEGAVPDVEEQGLQLQTRLRSLRMRRSGKSV
jgi:hypothetical protein